MIKCANCDKEAVLQYNVTDSVAIYYCAGDLPRFLKGKTAEASLKSVVVQPTPAPTKKKKAAAPVEETPTEE